MNLLAAIEAYLIVKRALGAVFSVDARILLSFARSIGDVSLEVISAELCLSFCKGRGSPTRFWARKHEALRGFFRYVVARGHLSVSPLVEPCPRIRSTFQAFIYSRDELRLLLDASTHQSHRSLLQPATLRACILLLYGAGLRAGEALRLRRCDVDLHDRLLTVRDTKFFKSRLVPIGRALCEGLARYWKNRECLGLVDEARSPFFACRNGKAISLAQLENSFVRLRKRAGVRRPVTERWQPRLHDLRATFAVHRLIAWYREGADVQARLPFLSTYLGHINVSGTQPYLTMTTELLAEASMRFERYASPAKEDDHE